MPIDWPNHRELKVLKGLCLGNVERPAYFAGIGPKTFSAMVSKGWIEPAYDSTYGVEGYRITDGGREVWEIHYRRA